ncbi:Transposase [Thermoplasmatales archaeon]|nr:Transposase [Thermoplasmatales archaeon]QRF74643.1 Transposase [Thermoplasmatales archaeon]QRF75736.1 Transposase [Thermoplasmatales archaeon]QRF75908.1 Transposase [Thermoplasmatales archaeon]
MNSEELFRRLLGLEEPWIIKEIKFDHQEKRVDIFIDFPKGSRFPCPVCGIPYGVHDTEERTWRHLNVFQYPTYVHAREPRIKCDQHGKKTADLPWARKGSGFSLHFEAMVVEMGKEMPVSSVARIVGINEDSVWRILKHYVDEARKDQDLSGISVLGIDEFSVEKHHVYVTLFYDIKNSRVIHIEEGKDSDVFMKFMQKNPFLDVRNIEHITMDMCPPYISGAKRYFPDSSIVFDHFHVIKMMNDALDRIRRKESRENEILKHTRYDWLKNFSDLLQKERDRLMSVKSLDLQTSHAYHFKIALQRLWQVNAGIAESYLRKWISWASRSRMPDIIKLGKTINRHLAGIMEAIRSGINSAVVEGLNNKIRTAFKRSYGFKAHEYRDTIIYLVAGGLKLPPQC